MQALPHTYSVNISASSSSNLDVNTDKLPPLVVAAPIEFDGPGDQWSPESLLLASVSSCLVLSFRAIAKATGLNWHSIECHTNGVLDKVERQMQFTQFTTVAKLVIATEADKDKAASVLIKAEKTCLVSNSLKAQSHLEYDIVIAQ
ncbi:MAG: OsmC family protein [Spongiibacteraceae bacterium]